MSDLAYRVAGPADQSAIAALDDSFTTEHVYEVAAGAVGFGLRMVAVDPPLAKVFPEDEPDAPDTDDDAHEIVAVDADGTVLGVVAVAVEEWNHRLVIRRITVDPAHRGRGIGGELMRRALAYGRDRGPVPPGWRSPASTSRRYGPTGAWDSGSAASTPRSTPARRPRARRPSSWPGPSKGLRAFRLDQAGSGSGALAVLSREVVDG